MSHIILPVYFYPPSLPVDWDADEDIPREEESEYPEEGHDPAEHVPGRPHDRGIPPDLQGHHEERHQQVGDGQVDQQQVHPGLVLPVATDKDVQHGEVGHAGHHEEGAVAHDGNDVGRVEPHVVRQLLILNSVRRLWNIT